MPSKNNISSLKKEKEEDRPILDPTKKEKINRVKKAFFVEENRAFEWDVLVAKMKRKHKKNGTVLIDEALDLLFDKYKGI